jgi:hypothetical protein
MVRGAEIKRKSPRAIGLKPGAVSLPPQLFPLDTSCYLIYQLLNLLITQ